MRLAQINAGTVEQLVVRLQATIARINTVWGKEHTGDGKHMLPEWHEVPFSAADFSSPSGWAVVASSTYLYWKHGDCLSLSFLLNGTVAGADGSLRIRLPQQMVPRTRAASVVDLATGPSGMTGLVVAEPGNPLLWVYKTDRQPFAAGTLNVNGQLQVRTTV